MDTYKLTQEEKKMIVDLLSTYVLEMNLEELKENDKELYNKYKQYEKLSKEVLHKLNHM